MSTQVMPNFSAIGFPVNRTPMWSAQIQSSISGMETRESFYNFPRYQWDVTIPVLSSSATPPGSLTANEYQSLLAFFNARQGSYDTFLYQDSDDNSVTSQALGTGNGATNSYQLVRTLSGSFTEPLLAPNTVSAVYLNSVSIPAAGISAPTNGALTQTAGGSLGGATYYVKSTWVTNSGETLPAGETSLAVSASHLLQVASPTGAPAQAIGWNVYVGTSSGAETLQNTSPITVGIQWTEPTSGLVSGAALPSINTTGWSVSNWGGVLPPTNGTLTSTAGGSLGSTTYYVRSTWVTATGETTPATESNLAVSANHLLQVPSPSNAPFGATGWNVYISNTAMGGSGAEVLQNASPIAVGIEYTEPTSGLVTGTAGLPAVNTTAPGVLSFGGNVRSGVAITADFSYYWPVRMVEDKLALSMFLGKMYECKKFSFISVKN